MPILQDWMTKAKATDDTLSKKLGVSRVQVSRLRRQIHQPSVATARKLEEITRIPAAKFLLDEPPKAGSDADAAAA